MTQFYFTVPKNVRLNSTAFFINKIPTNDCFNKLHLIIHHILSRLYESLEICKIKVSSFKSIKNFVDKIRDKEKYINK